MAGAGGGGSGDVAARADALPAAGTPAEKIGRGNLVSWSALWSVLCTERPGELLACSERAHCLISSCAAVKVRPSGGRHVSIDWLPANGRQAGDAAHGPANLAPVRG